MWNDVLRAMDRGERVDLVREVVGWMKEEGVEGNDVTWQYVGQAAAAAGEEGMLAELMGKEGAQEVEQNMQEELAALDTMTAADLFPSLDPVSQCSEEAQAQAEEVKAKMKADILNDLPLIQRS